MGKKYVIGHKNPDTDAISAALAIGELQSMLGENVIPARLGTLNEETKFATKYFDVEAPMLISDARTILKDITMDSPVCIKEQYSANDAFTVVTKTHNKTLFVTNDKNSLCGIVSIGDLASLKLKTKGELNKLLKASNLEIIAKDTSSKIIVENRFDFDGDVRILSSGDDIIKERSIILCRSKNLHYAIEKNPTLIIYTEAEKDDSEEIFIQAKQKNISILKSVKSLEEIVLAIYYAIPVSQIMSKQLTRFCENQFVDEVRDEMMKTRFRSYPVVDMEERLIGCVSRFHLFNYQKNQFILVDHSSLSQSINHLSDSEIIEVIDHHHIGDIQTKSPIDYRNRKCGSTCSIIYSMYVENGLLPTKKTAGMMLAAIISDTLHFKSKTTIDSDIKAAKALARICEVNLEEFSYNLLKASVDLNDVNIIDVIKRDLKEYQFGHYRIAVGQTNYSNLKDIQPRANEFKKEISQYQISNNYDLFIMMFTNVSAEGTYFIYSGNKSALMKQVIESEFDQSSGFDSTIMSRKQQLIPIIGKLLDN